PLIDRFFAVVHGVAMGVLPVLDRGLVVGLPVVAVVVVPERPVAADHHVTAAGAVTMAGRDIPAAPPVEVAARVVVDVARHDDHGVAVDGAAVVVDPDAAPEDVAAADVVAVIAHDVPAAVPVVVAADITMDVPFHHHPRHASGGVDHAAGQRETAERQQGNRQRSFHSSPITNDQ